MSNKQQTAVERFFMALQIRGLFINDDILKCYEQAKEMEKEQIMEARIDGDTWSTAIKEMRAKYAELYYNETYGGNK